MQSTVIGHAIAGTVVAGATAVAADHSIAVAIITAASGLAVVIVAQIGAGVREALRRKSVDHTAEHRDELLELVEFMRSELVEAHERENARKGRARRDQRE